MLSAGLEASDGTTDIARVAGLQQGAAGFIKEYHPKLKPVDTQRSGIFLAGTAQGPKNIPDSIAQAKAAAARVIAMLSAGFVLTPAQVASSDVDACIGCGVCESVCPQSAVALVGEGGEHPHATVEVNACRGCGICAAECPSGAMTLGGFSDDEILAEVTRLMSPVAAIATPAPAEAAGRKPTGDDAPRRIVAFYCRECAYAAADAAGNARTSLPTTIRSVLVPCTGRVSPLHLLSALAEGADGVYVAGCLEGQCHYREGNFHAIDRVKFCQRLLESVGVEPERVQMFTMSAADSPRFVRGGATHGPRHHRPAAAPAIGRRRRGERSRSTLPPGRLRCR